MNINVVRLEDNLEYGIIDTITNNGKHYLFLVNMLDDKKKVLRKVIKHDEKDVLVKLDSNEEYEEVMNLYYNKHKGERNEK